MNLVERMSTESVMVLSVLVMLIILTSGLMMRLKPGGITFKKITYLSIIALLFTISSLFWTKDTAYDRDTLTHLEFGWSIPFVIQNQERFEPPFPYSMIFDWGPSSNTEGRPAVQVVWKNGFASFAINFFVVLAVWYLCSSLLGRNLGMKR